MVAVQAREHGQGAAELDLLREQVGVGCKARVGIREPGREVLGECLEAEPLALKPAAAPVEKVVDRDPVDPRAHRGLAAVGVEASEDLEEDLLRGVLGVVGVPEHPQRQSVDIVTDA